jgi:hypothetical protein
MSTNPPKLPNSPSEKSIVLSENVPNSIGASEKVFDGFLGEKGLFSKKSSRHLEKSIGTSEKVRREHFTVVSRWNKYRGLGFRSEC